MYLLISKFVFGSGVADWSYKNFTNLECSFEGVLGKFL